MGNICLIQKIFVIPRLFLCAQSVIYLSDCTCVKSSPHFWCHILPLLMPVHNQIKYYALALPVQKDDTRNGARSLEDWQPHTLRKFLENTVKTLIHWTFFLLPCECTVTQNSYVKKILEELSSIYNTRKNGTQACQKRGMHHTWPVPVTLLNSQKK